MSSNSLLSGGSVALCCLGWCTFWFSLHPLARIWYKPPAELTWAVRYHVRLQRSSLYCFLAVLGGSFLMWKDWLSGDLVANMVSSFSMYHQILFSMAIGHWVNAIWEDFATKERLHQGVPGAEYMLLTGYVYHHIVTIFIYAYVLCTGLLGGLQGTLGLLFEAPVLLMNERELAFATSPKPQWLKHAASVRRHWTWTYAAFIVFRFGPSILYVCTLIPGTETHTYLQMRLSSPWHYIFYHCSAVFFILLNPVILGLLYVWHDVDRQALRGIRPHVHAVDDASKDASRDLQEEVESRAWPGGCAEGSIGSIGALAVALSLGLTFAIDDMKIRSDFWVESSYDALESRLDWRTPILCFCWTVVWFSGHYFCEILPIECLSQRYSSACVSESNGILPIKQMVFDLENSEPTITTCNVDDVDDVSSRVLHGQVAEKAENAEQVSLELMGTPACTELVDGIECERLWRFLRRTRRVFYYDVIATLTGGFLLLQCRTLPYDLLLNFSAAHRFFFTMSFGNWIVCFWEDVRSFSHLGHGLPGFEIAAYAGYFLHHIMASLAFGFCLLTWKLSGLCAIGLFFEVPWVFVTWRELQVARFGVNNVDDDGRSHKTWQSNTCFLCCFYSCALVLFLMARWGSTFLYIYALADPDWLSEVESLDRLSLALFHMLGIFFSLLNFALMGMLLSFFALDVRPKESIVEEQSIEPCPSIAEEQSIEPCSQTSALPPPPPPALSPEFSGPIGPPAMISPLSSPRSTASSEGDNYGTI